MAAFQRELQPPILLHFYDTKIGFTVSAQHMFLFSTINNVSTLLNQAIGSTLISKLKAGPSALLAPEANED
jgi:hypothetical protein